MMICRPIVRRVIAAAALLASVHAWANGLPVANDNEAATRAADITRDYALSKDRTECLFFDTADKGSYFLVRVRENHSQACGGEPGVSPVLFFMKIRKRDGHIVTTAYDGEHYRPLKPHHQD
ncbi:hypothetical protein [Paraburkholderia pallida]|uniref:Uncharacterized protein n=1 Tax=Paraburkholderia pallida TaxID=2547399 RepID=A0A4P7CUK8_9BURK|nr:hypothetical protein [Paraburkholderia pallida]QBQ98947.1 hypothetical protein E1956_17010 [Paraburkholderia pallida]